MPQDRTDTSFSATSPSELTPRVRLAYGFGLSAEGIKNNAFNVFLLFYYQQVVGLDPALCGTALFIALLVDAITDPLVGVLSDSTRSRWGRRHPFMLAASLPLAICYFAVFHPPMAASQNQIFVWLLVTVVGTRLGMTLFIIPHQSLVPELTPDYDERAKLQSLRTVFAWLLGLFNAWLGYTIFFAATDEYAIGLLNPAGYPRFALWGACAMLVATLVSTLGTVGAAARIQRRNEASTKGGASPTGSSIRELPRSLSNAARSDSYRVAVVAGLVLWIGFGVSENLGNYMNTFFWGFTSEELAILLYVIAGASALALAITPAVTRRFGKRRVALVSALGTPLIRPNMISLKMAGMLPEEGSRDLLVLLSCTTFVEYLGIIIAMTMVGAMIADVTDEVELQTGQRQEGLLFSGLLLMQKCSSGLGILIAGWVIKLAALDPSTQGAVDPDSVRRLGVFAAAAALGFGALCAASFSRYRLSRRRHNEILNELARRRTGA